MYEVFLLVACPLGVGVALIFIADWLKRKRDYEFLQGLDEIINHKDE